MNKEDFILWFGSAGIIITGIVMKMRQKKMITSDQAQYKGLFQLFHMDIDAFRRILIFALPGLLLTIILHLYGLWLFARLSVFPASDTEIARAGKWSETAFRAITNVGNGFHQIETLFVLILTWLLLILFKVKATESTRIAVRNFRLILVIPLFLLSLGTIVHISRNGATIAGLTLFSTVFFFLNLKIIGTAVISLTQIYFVKLLLKKNTSLYATENLSAFIRLFWFNIVLGLIISFRDLVFFFSKYGKYIDAGYYADALNDIWMPVVTVMQVVAIVASLFCWYVPFLIIKDDSGIFSSIKKSAIIFSRNFGVSALAFCLIFTLQLGLVSIVDHRKFMLESLGSGVYLVYFLVAPCTFLIPLLAVNIQSNIFNFGTRGNLA